MASIPANPATSGAEGRILTVPRVLPWVPNIGGGCSV